MTIERRTLLKAAAAVAAGVAGAAVAGCDDVHRESAPTQQHPSTPPTSPTSAAISPPANAGPPSAAPTSAASSASSTSGVPASQAPAHTGGPATEITHGPTTTARVALTFHGAGDPALATELLSAVETANARVTVLAVGTWLEQRPEMAKRILGGGHELGNHTYRHLTMTSLSSAVDDSEITKCADVLRRLTGSQGRWFRPSGTVHATPAVLAAAGRAGYSNSLSYDVDPADYADPGADLVIRRVLDAVRPGSIVSLHLGHAGTVKAMSAILTGLQKLGLAAVTMSTLIDDAA